MFKRYFVFFLATLLTGSLLIAANQNTQTSQSGRLYYFYNYLANGVPAGGYNASPYLPDGMQGIGTEDAQKIMNHAMSSTKGAVDDLSIIRGNTLKAASDLYGKDSAQFTAVNKAWTALNVTAGSITVTSPAGGETWQLRNKYTIKWTYSYPPGPNVAIWSEYQVGSMWYPLDQITASTSIGSSGTGSFVWTVPCDSSTTTNIRFRVYSTVDSTYKADSNAFKLRDAAPPSITVTNPISGASWKEGTIHMIKWTYASNPGTSVKLLLIDMNPYHTLNYTIVNNVSMGSGGSGSYSWTIPTNLYPDALYYIVIQSNTYSCYKTQSDFFTLTAP